jgi:hypothetical protein
MGCGLFARIRLAVTLKVRAEGAPRRATASKSALAGLDTRHSEIGKPDFGWRPLLPLPVGERAG